MWREVIIRDEWAKVHNTYGPYESIISQDRDRMSLIVLYSGLISPNITINY